MHAHDTRPIAGMPRPTLFDHPKFHRLVHMLQMPEPHVLGHLEYLWRVGYSSGNPIVGDALDVEIAAKWTGASGHFVAALADDTVRLLDVLDDGRYQIHDLHENAPGYVKSRARMERLRKRRKPGSAKARTPAQRLRNSDAHVRQGRELGYASPAPAPAPAPGTPQIEELSEERADVAFDRFWQAYPAHRRSRSRMVQELFVGAWRAAGGVQVLLDALENHLASDDWREPRLVPGMEKWLERQAWRNVHPRANERGAPSTRRNCGRCVAGWQVEDGQWVVDSDGVRVRCACWSAEDVA